MKVIVPLAGFGKRMRPHTWSKPKPLLNVAGKPVLGHVLDDLAPLNPEQVVFIVGWLGDQIKDYVSSHYQLDARYVVQEELKGQAHALYLAREYITGPCVIVFVDTLFEADVSGFQDEPVDGILFVKEVVDPRRFGVAVERDGRVVRLIEKPDTFEHRNAVVGLYYVKDGAALVAAIEYLLAHNLQTKGEFYLADALQVMIDRGARFATRQVAVWEDCGKPETLLHTQRYLLERGPTQMVDAPQTTLIPPVHIAPSARIERSVIGPYVTVGENAVVSGSVIRDAIIEKGATIENVVIQNSLVGCHAVVRGGVSQLNVGDDAAVSLGPELFSPEGADT